jgi:hypothetical protein
MEIHDERNGHAIYYVSCVSYFFNGFKIVKCEKCKQKWNSTLAADSTCPGGNK